MKTTILIKESRTQLVLEAETDHERQVLDMLEKLPGTFRGEFFDNQAGYTRGYESYGTGYGRGKDKDLIIVFNESVANSKD